MVRGKTELLYVGIKSSVVALEWNSGAEVWRRKLAGGDFTNVHWDGERLFATNRGEVFRLDPATGAVLWCNPLKGLGWGVASLAASTQPPQPNSAYVTTAAEVKRKRDVAGASAAG